MPRKFLSQIHQYYEFIDGRSICQIADYEGNMCNVSVKGRHAGNLEKHILRCHEEVWNDYFNNVKVPQLMTRSDSSAPAPKKPKSSPEYLNLSSTSLKSIRFSYRNIERACVMMATVDGRPFSFVDEIGFRMVLNPLLGLMNCPISGFSNCSLNKNKVIKLIKEEAEMLKQVIVERLANRLVALKIDCIYFMGRYYLNCTVHSGEETATYSFTFPLIEVRNINNVEAIKEAILVLLSRYEISIHQIFSITVDNSANMIGSDLLKLDTEKDSSEKFVNEGVGAGDAESRMHDGAPDIVTDSEYDTFVVEVDYDDEGEAEENNGAEQEKENVYEQTEEFVDKVMECWPSDEDLDLINSRCVANMFQSVILEALNNPRLQTLIKKVREVIKKLKSFNYMTQLKSLNCRKALLLDCNDRWITTYEMFERLLELKSYILKISRAKELFISPSQWEQVEGVVLSLKACKVATLRLQREDISMSEFFKVWSVCLLKTRKIDSPLAKTICANLEKKQKKLFNNVAFASCVFLDPRFKNILELKDQVEIIEYLAKLYERITMFNPITPTNEEEIISDEIQIKTDPSGDGNTSDEELDNFLKTIIKDRTPKEDQGFNDANIRMLLQAFFDAEPFLDMKEDVSMFWFGKKYAYPELYRMAQVILSIPASQTSVQKLASQLKYIYNSSCPSSLNSLLTYDILLIRANSEHVLEYWNNEDQQQ